MKVIYFADTDTLYIEFTAGPVAETRDLDEHTLLNVDAEQRICAITAPPWPPRALRPRVTL